MNLFEKAVNTGELSKFALGQGEYFILDREYDGHWINGSWINYILPALQRVNKLSTALRMSLTSQ